MNRGSTAPKRPKTIWFSPETLAKISEIQAIDGEPYKVINELRKSFEARVDELYEERQRNKARSSHP